jgi:hypothetical protein
MKVYELKDTTPYPKLKHDNTVFELKTQNDFEQAILDNEGEIFIEDTKCYLLTKNNRCYVLFYKDKGLIVRMLKERLNGGISDDHNRRNISK